MKNIFALSCFIFFFLYSQAERVAYLETFDKTEQVTEEC